ncbi:unnamed protein product [Effrenium voratum]|uniref:Beta-lactamase-related domain-containing protein n=1 Tax=Effrenium voratum TaxID=2562239 RepID=A0AA36HXG3_9DINO|nr:unnamed protein product [Effrenium voratum]CAJ1445551.1 unnamed protein product [Effrenium voratum]
MARKRSACGLDPQRLQEFEESLRREVQIGSLAGAVHLVLRKGRTVYSCAAGFADVERKRRFTAGTLCRLHGATKPLLSAAFLALVDAGRCCLDDPIDQYLPFPELLARKARDAGDNAQKATLRHLLTMTSGLGYEDCKAYQGLMRSVRQRRTRRLRSFCKELLRLPLRSAPGKRYDYSFAYDVLGRVCEEISGLPLPKFMSKYLFRPLGMKDTHFTVPAHKKKRQAVLYTSKKLKSKTPRYRLARFRGASAPGILSGGGGLLSYEDPGLWGSAADYAKFLNALAGGKSPSGRQIWKASTVRKLWEDSLAPFTQPDGRLPGWHDADGSAEGGWWDFRGLSLLHSYLDLDEPPKRRRGAKPEARNSSSMWFSGGGGAFWTMEKGGIATVSFVQTLGGREDDTDGLGPLAYRLAPCL